jgi:hypothetical protein
VGFCPCGRIPLSRLAPWPFGSVAGRPKIAAALDTAMRIRQSEPKANSTEVPPHCDDYIVETSIEGNFGSGNAADFKSLEPEAAARRIVSVITSVLLAVNLEILRNLICPSAVGRKQGVPRSLVAAWMMRSEEKSTQRPGFKTTWGIFRVYNVNE